MLTRLLARLGFREDSFLLLAAILIGMVTAAAAVGFHELIHQIRKILYEQVNPEFLYGPGIVLLIAFPAMGGLAVGLISRYIARTREGHGIIDVMEQVIRARGVIKPTVAVEKIITSALTIGSGGSAGAEGPIVQIGAAIASGIGQLFRIARQHMPILIGCGSAAGISAIFNAPIGGVLFTLEVILQDFSIRTFTPVVLASVIANVTTQAIFRQIHNISEYQAIFAMPMGMISQHLSWDQVGNFILLGLLCGLIGVGLTRLMYFSEERFSHLKIPPAIKPALGGAVVGTAGVTYVMLFGWFLLNQRKPFAFEHYPMPAFFGDGYGVIQQLLQSRFYETNSIGNLLILLAFLCLVKIFATCMTLASGGSGGIIAPSLFLGATGGGFLGILLQWTSWFPNLQPQVYALVGMGAVLSAVVHAPLASILILVELTRDDKIILPAMLASIFATGMARFIFRDSIYTLGLRRRGVRVGASSDIMLLRRMSVEQIDLEPASIVRVDDPLQHLLDLIADTGAADFVVVDPVGNFAGMVVAGDIQTALIDREAIPLLLVGEIMRVDVALVSYSDDLAAVLDAFSLHDVARLPVCLSRDSGKVIGLISRSALMKRYQRALAES